LAALAALAWVFGAHPLRAQGAEPDPKIVERPEWSVGDWWEVREGSTVWRLTVIEKDGAQYVLARTKAGESASDTAGKTKLYADRDGWITKIAQPDGRTTETGDKREYVQFPLSVGKRWFFNISTKSTSGVPTAYSYACQADKWDTIEVGTRQVRALKLSCSSTNRSTSSTFSHTGWYALEAKRVVRFFSDYKGGPTIEVTAWGMRPGEAGSTVASAPSRPLVPASPVLPRQPAGSPPRQETASPPATGASPAAGPPPPAAVSSADTEPPKIAINYPPPATKVERDDIVILGLVTDNLGIDRVQVTLNGIEVQKPIDAGGATKSIPIRSALKLQPGDNIIEITATDKAGNAAQLVRTVTRVMPAVASPVPAQAGPAVGDRWAVIIGVGRYDNGDVPTLRYAVPDAESIYQVLTGPAGFKKEHVLLLTDKGERKPTLRNIRWALGTFLSRSARKDDTVVIFFAATAPGWTHAASNATARSILSRAMRTLTIYSSALPMDELQTIFGRIESERVVAFRMPATAERRVAERSWRRHARSSGRSVPRAPHTFQGPVS
jgi:hypothetical protein